MKLILLLIFALPAFAQNAYYGSVAVLIAGQSADAYTTLHPNPGTYELNPLGPRGVVDRESRGHQSAARRGIVPIGCES